MVGAVEEYERGLVLPLCKPLHATDEDQMVLERVQYVTGPLIVALNKTDRIEDKAELMPHLSWLQEQLPNAQIIPISAQHGHNLEALERVIAARSAVAKNIAGPWMELKNPCVGPKAGITFGGQSTFILPVQGKPGKFIFMADIWRPKNAIDGRYLWLPMKWEGDQIILEWKDEWTLDDL